MITELQEIKIRIVKEAITQVLCIDDEFIMPYTTNDKQIENYENNYKWTKNLFDELISTYNSVVDIQKYEKASYDKYLEKFDNKDLLVLDWEMLPPGVLQYQDSLKLLGEAVKSDIPFICIYTKSPDIYNIYECILNYFCGMSEGEVDEIATGWIDTLQPDEEFERDVIKCFDEYEIKDLTKNLISLLSKQEMKDLKEAGIKYGNSENWIPLYLQYKKILLPKEKLPKARWERRTDKPININGKLIICFYKDCNVVTGDNNLVVSPQKIVDYIATNLSEAPNSIFNIIWLKYKNHFNHLLYKHGAFFQDISDQAFYHYSQQLKMNHGEEALTDAISEFIKNLYKDEIISKLNNDDAGLEQCIINEINKNAAYSNKDTELVKLNYFFCINKDLKGINRRIQFGDVFFINDNEVKDKEQTHIETSNMFWLCVTPHCDCLRPQRINHNYLFIRGEEYGDNKSLKRAEKDNYSFIKDGDRYISIKWQQRLNSIYIQENNDNMNENGTITAYYKNHEFVMKYICTLKENYAQRFANAAFSFNNRVGISYANLGFEDDREIEKCDNCGKCSECQNCENVVNCTTQADKEAAIALIE
jgi:hypothetical protein